MKKSILVILSALLLCGCSVKEQETEITVFKNTVSALYTGKVKRKIPNGEGTASVENSGTVKGTFEQGTFLSGSAENIPYSTAFNDQTVTGIYTGEVSEQLPSGTGSFSSDAFSYEGSWKNGMPDGSGTLTAESFSVAVPSGTLEGSYSGDVTNGLAEGNGTFVYPDGNTEVEMRGTFANNTFDGMLVKTVRYPNTEKSWPVYYTGGSAEKSAAGILAYLEGMRKDSYCLNDAQISFLIDHAALFEGSSKEFSDYNTAFDYEAFQETDTPAIIRIDNAVIKSVQRYVPYEGADTVTSMIVQNSSGWYHLFFAYSVDGVSNGDTVSICALPLCRSTLTAPEGDCPAIDAAGAMIIGG